MSAPVQPHPWTTARCIVLINFALTSVKAAAHLRCIRTFKFRTSPPPPTRVFACREEEQQRIFPPYWPGPGSQRDQQAGSEQTWRCCERRELTRRAHCRYVIRIPHISSDSCYSFPFLWLSNWVWTCSFKFSHLSISRLNHTKSCITRNDADTTVGRCCVCPRETARQTLTGSLSDGGGPITQMSA